MAQVMRYRPCNWGNPQFPAKKRYGIMALRPGAGEWLHVCSGNKALLFNSAEERDAKIAELRAKARRETAA